MNGVEQVKKCVMLVVLLLVAAASASAQLPGAIFTTTQNGTRVNANQYPAKCGSLGVWLDGGPGPNAPVGAAGLPEGDYYFQVTDPSGKTLLSTDPVINRQFHVNALGVISGLSGAGNHNTAVDTDHAAQGAMTIELCPFNNTPNPGGVYKAWVTPVGGPGAVCGFVGDPTLVDNGYHPGYFHGFIPSCSNVDNFKVIAPGQPPTACMGVYKFIDANGNGIREPQLGETRIGGWPFVVFDPLGNQIQGTIFTTIEHLKDCHPSLFNLTPGKYLVVEFATDGSGTFKVTANIVDTTNQNPVDLEIKVTFSNNDLRHDVFFGNQKQ